MADVTYETLTPEEELGIVQARLHDAELQHFQLTVNANLPGAGDQSNQLAQLAQTVTDLQGRYNPLKEQIAQAAAAPADGTATA